MKIIVYQIIFLFIFSPLFTQEASKDKYGFFFDLNNNRHYTDFRALPNVPNCCPHFEYATGYGISIGAFYELPVYNDFSLQLRGGYSRRSAEFNETESILLAIDNVEYSGEFTHIIETDFSSFAIQPLLNYRLNGRFFIALGTNLAYIINNTYSQREELSKPEGQGVFTETLTRVRNESSGSIDDLTKFRMALTGFIRYEIPLNERESVSIAPEINFNYGLNPLVKNVTWDMHSIQAGIAVIFKEPKRFADDFEIDDLDLDIGSTSIETVYGDYDVPDYEKEQRLVIKPIGITRNRDTVKIGTYRSHANLEDDLIIEEFLRHQMSPLLNYIFFDENSNKIPARYTKLSRDEAEAFSIDDLKNNMTMDNYYQILNVIGLRLKLNEGSRIKLTGCNSNYGPEKNNIPLSNSRAEAVRDYLTDIWQIDPDRISLESRTLPEKASNNETEEGRQENRRVEIYLDSWEIGQPLVLKDTLRVADPPVIVFTTEVKSDFGVKEWSLVIRQEDQILLEEYGEDIIPKEIRWNVDDDKERMPALSSPVRYNLSAQDRKGREIINTKNEMSVGQISIRKKRYEQGIETELNNFRLILFDYDDANISPDNMKIIEFIKENISEGAQVTITGYTDNIGDAGHNRELSMKRAQNVADLLGIDKVIIKGSGEDNSPFENQLPEERFFSRTVVVEFEKELER